MPRGFGFVYRSIAISLSRSAQPYYHIRDFCVAVQSNHARWALAEAVRLLRLHPATFAAARVALQRGHALAATVTAMEAALERDGC